MKSRTKKILKMIKTISKYLFYSFICKVKRIDNSDVWLLAERGVDARDNTYHFYNYLKRNHPEVRIKYIISNDSPDRNRIIDEDIVEYGSKEHFILFKTAGVLISTHIMGYSPDTSLFWRMDRIRKIKLKGKRVFLQHGVTCSRVQSLERDVARLDLFITCSNNETNYIKDEYGYDDSIVKCTGFARFDKLIDRSKKDDAKILIMPTFRKWLNYSDKFEDSEYFKRWNGLLNNEDFIDFVEKKNIKVLFYPHFEIQKRLNCFKSKSDNIVICSMNDYDVQDLLLQSNILITDFSSVAFDFGYMNKPIIYYHFDIDDYYAKHYQRGYFDYKKDGFGETPNNIDDLVQLIKKYETSGFRMRKEYEKRLSGFFSHMDFDNCARIYEEIKELREE